MAVIRFPSHLTLIGRPETVGNLAERRADAEHEPIPFPTAGAFTRDSLCDVASSRGLMERLHLVGSIAPTSPLSFLAVKVDGLRALNEASGWEAGDEALKAIAEELQSLSRATDLVGRLAGAVFGVVLQGTGATAASAVAARLSFRVNQTLGPSSPVGVRISAASGTGVHCETLVIAAMDSFGD